MAENFLELMLKNRPELEQSFADTAVDREKLAGLLKQSPVVDTVFPSGGDFLLVRLAGNAAAADLWARRMVQEHEILVKDVSAKMGDGHGYWRLAVRTPADHGRLISALMSLSPAS